jgi:hypothetical protein
MKQATSWTTCGFESFRQGAFGNAGQNLYVSRAGILQRMHQYDLNRDAYFDLLFCNSQSKGENPPAYVYGFPRQVLEEDERTIVYVNHEGILLRRA